jgi:tetratricopeptide (TPR) repeat protein
VLISVEIPEPLPSPALITLWAEVASRQTLDEHETVKKLDEPAWQKRRQQLLALEPPEPFRQVASDEYYWLRLEVDVENLEPATKLRLLDRLMEHDKSAELLKMRCACQTHLKEYDRAAADFLHALELSGKADYSCPDNHRPIEFGGLRIKAADWREVMERLIKQLPEEAQLYREQSNILTRLGEYDRAAAAYVEYWNRNPKERIDLEISSAFLRNQFSASDFSFLPTLDKIISRMPKEEIFQGLRDIAVADKGKKSRTLEAYRQYLSLDGKRWIAHLGLVEYYLILMLEQGELLDYGAGCKRLWDAASVSDRLSENDLYDVANLMILGSQPLADLQPVLDRAQKLLAQTDELDMEGRRMLLDLLGAIHFRAGRYEKALAALRSVDPKEEKRAAVALLFQALTLQKLGRTAEAGQMLDQAKDQARKSPTQDAVYRLLLREAESLIRPVKK